MLIIPCIDLLVLKCFEERAPKLRFQKTPPFGISAIEPTDFRMVEQ